MCHNDAIPAPKASNTATLRQVAQHDGVNVVYGVPGSGPDAGVVTALDGIFDGRVGSSCGSPL